MIVYFDNAATTQIRKEVYQAMKPYLTSEFGNPSSLHQKGIENKRVINTQRNKIAEMLHCKKEEIFFTSSGTESINWAIKGLAFAHNSKSEIITTKIEHHATLKTVEFLEELGFTIHYVDVDKEGFIDLNHLESLINENTLLVSVIYANNEIGTIQDVHKISEICRLHSVYLHLDAVQAICHIPIDLEKLDVDLLSISGHKFHGPKGIGILYIKEHTNIASLLHGGQQERGLRAGTENIAYIKGITEALRLGLSELDEYNETLKELNQYFVEQLKKARLDFIINGPLDLDKKLKSNINVSFRNVNNNQLLYQLNKQEIYASSGSACDSGSIEPSHVLKAIQVDPNYIIGSIRFSLNKESTKDEIDYVICKLKNIIK